MLLLFYLLLYVRLVALSVQWWQKKPFLFFIVFSPKTVAHRQYVPRLWFISRSTAVRFRTSESRPIEPVKVGISDFHRDPMPRGSTAVRLSVFPTRPDRGPLPERAPRRRTPHHIIPLHRVRFASATPPPSKITRRPTASLKRSCVRTHNRSLIARGEWLDYWRSPARWAPNLTGTRRIVARAPVAPEEERAR